MLVGIRDLYGSNHTTCHPDICRNYWRHGRQETETACDRRLYPGQRHFLQFFSDCNQSEGAVFALAQIGVTLLLFTIGIEFSLDKLLAVKKYALIGGSAR